MRIQAATETTEALSPKQAVRQAVQVTRNITTTKIEIRAAQQALHNLRHIALFDAANVIDSNLIRTLMNQLEQAEEVLSAQQDTAMEAIFTRL